MSLSRRRLLAACLACFVGTPGFAVPSSGTAPEPSVLADAAGFSVSVSDGAPAQGAPLLVEVAATGSADNIVLLWDGTSWPLLEIAPGRYEGLIGVDLLAPAGRETLAVVSSVKGVQTRVEKVLTVGAGRFAVQELTLPKKMTRFDAPTLRRIREEAKALEERFARVTRPVLWRVPFLPPVE